MTKSSMKSIYPETSRNYLWKRFPRKLLVTRKLQRHTKKLLVTTGETIPKAHHFGPSILGGQASIAHCREKNPAESFKRLKESES